MPATKLTVMRTGQPNVPGKLVNPEKEKAAARMRCVKSAPSNMPEHSIPFHARTLHTLSCQLPKNTPKQDIEKALYKKCKKHSCRDALPPTKNTSPKTNETSDNAHRKACTDYPHITSTMHLLRTYHPYICYVRQAMLLVGVESA